MRQTLLSERQTIDPRSTGSNMFLFRRSRAAEAGTHLDQLLKIVAGICRRAGRQRQIGEMGPDGIFDHALIGCDHECRPGHEEEKTYRFEGLDGGFRQTSVQVVNDHDQSMNIGRAQSSMNSSRNAWMWVGRVSASASPRQPVTPFTNPVTSETSISSPAASSLLPMSMMPETISGDGMFAGQTGNAKPPAFDATFMRSTRFNSFSDASLSFVLVARSRNS